MKAKGPGLTRNTLIGLHPPASQPVPQSQPSLEKTEANPPPSAAPVPSRPRFNTMLGLGDLSAPESQREQPQPDQPAAVDEIRQMIAESDPLGGIIDIQMPAQDESSQVQPSAPVGVFPPKRVLPSEYGKRGTVRMTPGVIIAPEPPKQNNVPTVKLKTIERSAHPQSIDDIRTGSRRSIALIIGGVAFVAGIAGTAVLAARAKQQNSDLIQNVDTTAVSATTLASSADLEPPSPSSTASSENTAPVAPAESLDAGIPQKVIQPKPTYKPMYPKQVPYPSAKKPAKP